ncbi:MAG: ethanolamine utilization protein EutJ [Anaerolineaceae bacterium]|jgi:ethanolamine utilization protein EutJ|nr:ethanolamine utilization protein EutJ [Anaerolineaceae bacterium]
MNPHLATILTRADQVILHSPSHSSASRTDTLPPQPADWHVGVDLGTAYTVLTVMDGAGLPLAGAYRFAQVVRDGLVVDFFGAVTLLSDLKAQVEERLGFSLNAAASGYPPGVPQAEVRATANVLEAAGLDCSGLVDEPTAANTILGLQNGAIVDVGGGTTGVAILQNGQVVYTADEPTGGTHFTLTIAGALDIPFEEAEAIKIDPGAQQQLYPTVRPVMEKVAAITQKHLAGYTVDAIYLVGGTCKFPRMAETMGTYLDLPVRIPGNPLFVTPLGIAMHHGA